GLGASSIALFARVGGGIYTKAADVGGDLVGKVEAGIPEDDPRNPATIADAVGDNVGDVAGMGADLFESYSGSIIAPVALTAFSLGLTAEAAGDEPIVQLLVFPMAIAFVGMIGAIIGSFAVRGGNSTDVKALSKQLHRGTTVAMVLTVIGTLVMGRIFFGDGDLFESYSGSIIAPVALTAFSLGLAADAATDDWNVQLLMFPMAVALVGMVGAIIGSFAVRGGDSTEVKDLAKQLHRGTTVAMVLTVIGTLIMGRVFFGDGDLFEAWYGLPISVIGGLAVGWGIGKVAEIWTSDHYPPVKRIAAQAETGPATTVLSGISAGMVSVAASVGLIAVGVLVAYWGGQQTLGESALNGGVYGIAVAAVGMLATTGVVVSVDAYGPIADNAGGIAEMAELDPSVREVTDALDSLGNTTAAVAKGFAVGSAALTALALFKTFEVALERAAGREGVLSLDVGSVDVFIGLFLGAMVPFLFAALTIDAVGRAANKMIEEVRRQFREIPGLREGAEGVSPDSARCVAISTQASLREMLAPGALAVVVPLVIGFIDVDALGGFLAGALVTGFALAIFMANAGGAWDNAKKYIEAGAHGGKGSEPHKASVVGDTLGDPFKDTSGPSMNILIKVMTIVSLVFASAFV
ncbi:MAG: sodium-translocating pyrophosphatase, partial [Acidimicrobiaceae bacterium]|nr:sodium-translocating pyrophosphatase [Acidimicrobiaceae bacterium]